MALLAAYNFDEASGDFLDASGNGRNWTPNNNAARTASGHTNGGLTKSGTGLPVIVSPAIGQTSGRTFMFWMKGAGTAVWWLRFYASTPDTGTWGLYLLSGNLTMRLRKGGSNTNTSVAWTDDGLWHHYACTYDGTNAKLYKDATLVATSASVTAPLDSADLIDCMESGNNTQTMDDLRIYDEALTQAQISTLMDTPVTGGGAVALDGTGSAASSATGALSRARRLSGTASGAASATGALSRSRPVDGAASAASSASGSLSVARGMTGDAPASSAADGDLSLAGIVNLDGSATAAADAAGTVTVGRGLTGSASSPSSASGELSMVTPVWRLVMPAIPERHVIKGSLAVTINREATVFGDENGLFTTERGSAAEGSDDYGAIPFGTKYIWYGGHVNTTDDPAVKNLWLSHGFEVENVVS